MKSCMKTQISGVLSPGILGLTAICDSSIKFFGSLQKLIGLLHCSSLILYLTAMAVDCWKSVERRNGT